MISISVLDVLSWFDNKTITKATPYLAKVSNITWSNDNTIIATVKGSDPHPYRQRIILGVDDKQKTYIQSSTCSCPVGHHCKHVAAIMMKLASENLISELPIDLSPAKLKTAVAKKVAANETKIETKIDTYFATLYSNIEEQHKRLPPELDAGKDHLLWVLSVTKNYYDGQRFILEPIRVKRLQNGSWSTKINAVTNIERWIQGYQLPAYLSPFDIEIATLVFANDEPYYYGDGYSISGELGFIILNKLITAKRLLWGEVKQKQRHFYQLSGEQDMQLPLIWHEQKKKWALTHQLKEHFDSFTLIPTNPVMLLGQKGQINTLRSLITDLPIGIIQQLSSPVYLAQEELFDRWQPVYEFYHTIPPLPDSAMAHIEVYSAQPVLTIGYLTQHNNITQISEPLLASLQFRYDDLELLPVLDAVDHVPTIQPIVMADGKKRLIKRDIATEKRAKNQSPHVLPIDWLPLLESISALQQEGWEIILQDPQLHDIEQSTDIQITLIDDDQAFALDAQLQTNSGELPILPLLLTWIEQRQPLPESGFIWLPHPETGKFIKVPVDLIKPVFQTVTEL